MKPIDIVMATYNGELHLSEQIASIQSQSYPHWRLLVRDDGSTDGTLELLRGFAERDNRIEIVNDDHGNLGVVANFNSILELTMADLVFLCDQDDVWFPEKISSFVSFTEACGLGQKENEPLLIFSDLELADDRLQVLAPSYMEMQQRAHCLDFRFRNLLTQNVMPGCAMMVNRALLRQALPMPARAGMHDWWLMLVAACFGRVVYLDKPLAAYRQHPTNVMGAVKPSIKSLLGRGLSKYKQRLRAGEWQAQAFIKRFHGQIQQEDLSAATCLAELPTKGFLQKRIDAYRHGLRKDGFLRTLAFYALM